MGQAFPRVRHVDDPGGIAGGRKAAGVIEFSLIGRGRGACSGCGRRAREFTICLQIRAGRVYAPYGLDLIDELQLSLFPYVAGEVTRLVDGVPKSYRLDLVSSTASSNGIVALQYRRHR